MLDLSSLRNALGQLETMLRFYETAQNKRDIEGALVGRTALIQAFEFTYTLSIKTLRRALEIIAPEQGVDREMNYSSMLLVAKDFGLISDKERWITYRDNRNKTSHTYNEDRALNVLTVVPSFIEDVHRLLDMIERELQDKP